MTDRLLYDKYAAAEQLSTSHYRIDELRRTGELVGVRSGRKWFYTRDELARYVASLPTSEPR